MTFFTKSQRDWVVVTKPAGGDLLRGLRVRHFFLLPLWNVLRCRWPPGQLYSRRFPQTFSSRGQKITNVKILPQFFFHSPKTKTNSRSKQRAEFTAALLGPNLPWWTLWKKCDTKNNLIFFHTLRITIFKYFEGELDNLNWNYRDVFFTYHLLPWFLVYNLDIMEKVLQDLFFHSAFWFWSWLLNLSELGIVYRLWNQTLKVICSQNQRKWSFRKLKGCLENWWNQFSFSTLSSNILCM